MNQSLKNYFTLARSKESQHQNIVRDLKCFLKSLGVSDTIITLEDEHDLSAVEISKLDTFFSSYLSGIPLDYILNESEFMGKLEAKMAEDDVMVLVHGYLAGGFVGKDKCITNPDDVKGLQTRAAGKAFEQMLVGAGASIASMASSEIYNAMQTGVLNAANTSSSSFVSYRIYEQVKCYTPAGDVALWFMYQPLLMNKSKFESLSDAQQAALKAGAAKAEAYYLEEAKKQDAASVKVFADAGVEIANMSPADFEAWRAIAMETSYKKFVSDVSDGQELLDLALSVD